ncbi:MAG: hypothetical protein JJ992_25235, partial [Planctomycetes bacterium]|nr:hypothetical protein [Planctomycetota bacterium]
TVDPRAEWKQIFNDVWRFERDYFYDPNMHGVDWAELRVRYGKLLDSAVTRWDVNTVIGELIAEMSSSHTYRGGGDTEQSKDVDHRSNRAASIQQCVAASGSVRSDAAHSGIRVSGSLPDSWRQFFVIDFRRPQPDA